jgi:hypothetical protein
MSIEVALPYGGDFSLDATGDLLLVEDGNGAYPALQQRIIQMLLTSPQIKDSNGNPIPGSADDMFNPTAGAGLRRAVGNVENNALLAEIEARMIEGLSKEPDVAPYPAPQIEFVVYPNGVVCNLTFATVDGQVIALPPIPLTPSGA